MDNANTLLLYHKSDNISSVGRAGSARPAEPAAIDLKAGRTGSH